MTTTGYNDTFNRTVSGGFGTATSGQTYTISGTAAGYSVTPSTASLAISQGGNISAMVDLGSGLNVDISGRVALSAIPATNLATVGFFAKASSVNNWYSGSMMVATGGAISVRFTKVVAGGTVTIATIATGLTYVANTFYNLRFNVYWSRTLQTNILQAKLWTLAAAQPVGWTASTTDTAFTDYTGGTLGGLMVRDESTTVGTITAKYQAVASNSYSLPVPASTDPMCSDPAVAYPKQTALQSLASAVDSAVATIDPLTSLAGLFPRVRVSSSLTTLATATGNFVGFTYGATEFNVGTSTDLGYNNRGVSLPVGIWLVTFEIQLVEAASDYLQLTFFSGSALGVFAQYMRSNAVQSNDNGVGGTCHMSTLMYSTDPSTPITVGVYPIANNTATTYTITYMALSAVKISDYFS